MDKIVTTALAVIIMAIVAMLVLNPVSAGAGNALKVPGAGSPPLQQPGPPSAGNGTTQTFTLGFNGVQYTPVEIRVKQGTKVRIEGDPGTLFGCMSTVNIDGYGISKYIRSGDNVIEFTADTTGTFPIHCNMGMGNGRLVVEDDTGTVPVQSQAPAVARGAGGCCG